VDLEVFGHLGTQNRFQVRRLRGNCVQPFMSIRIAIFFTPDPDVIWYSDYKRNDKSIAAVKRFDCAEAIFQVVSSGGIEENAIEFKPE